MKKIPLWKGLFIVVFIAFILRHFIGGTVGVGDFLNLLIIILGGWGIVAYFQKKPIQ